jgi:hypothetical protein
MVLLVDGKDLALVGIQPAEEIVERLKKRRLLRRRRDDHERLARYPCPLVGGV